MMESGWGCSVVFGPPPSPGSLSPSLLGLALFLFHSLLFSFHDGPVSTPPTPHTSSGCLVRQVARGRLHGSCLRSASGVLRRGRVNVVGGVGSLGQSRCFRGVFLFFFSSPEPSNGAVRAGSESKQFCKREGSRSENGAAAKDAVGRQTRPYLPAFASCQSPEGRRGARIRQDPHPRPPWLCFDLPSAPEDVAPAHGRNLGPNRST